MPKPYTASTGRRERAARTIDMDLERCRGLWLEPELRRFVEWHRSAGYAPSVTARYLKRLVAFADFAGSHGVKANEDLPRVQDAFVAHWLRDHRRRCRSGPAQRTVKAEASAPTTQLLRLVAPSHFKQLEAKAYAFRPFAHEAPGFFPYLSEERGLSAETIRQYRYSLGQLEACLRKRRALDLMTLRADLLADFLTSHTRRTSPVTGSAACGHVREFLRYLFREGLCPRDLTSALDWPKNYRFKRLPRSLSREGVESALRAARAQTEVGVRDFAILSLLAVYGLRAREIARLRLDHIDWRHEQLLVPGRKNGDSTCYALSRVVGQAILRYLREARPKCTLRSVFITDRAPFKPLRHFTVSGRASRVLSLCGIKVPRAGSHTFRHSVVQRMLDRELPYRTIADFVGHRTTGSTRLYGRLSVERLRRVAVADGEAIL